MNGTGPARRCRIALATAEGEWDHDEDGPLLLDALEREEVEATPAVWSDPSVRWEAFDLVVVRSTWDYTERRDEFLGWADDVASRTALVNPPHVLRWNTDKRYLADLADAGVRVVDTEFVAAGSSTDGLEARLADRGEVVVKPTVSAGSRDTARHPAGAHREAAEHVRRLLDAGRDVMLQPYLGAVDTAGETGIVCFDGVVSHAFRKGPMLRDGWAAVRGSFAPEVIEPRDPTAEELAAAEQVLRAAAGRLGGTPAYARVDLVPGPAGEPTLLELELTEPSFFLAHGRGGAARAAACFAAHARRSGPARR
jgi:glutathione synthase/RimK-type ligase-like ATP-grasp enzyme